MKYLSVSENARAQFKEFLENKVGVSNPELQEFDLVLEQKLDPLKPQVIFEPVKGTAYDNQTPTAILLGSNDAFLGFAMLLGIKKVEGTNWATEVSTFVNKAIFTDVDEQKCLEAVHNGTLSFGTQASGTRNTPFERYSTRNFLFRPELHADGTPILGASHLEKGFVNQSFKYVLSGQISQQEYILQLGKRDISKIDDEGKNYAILIVKGILAVGQGKAVADFLSRK